MRVSQLIEILKADLAQNDDREVLYLSGSSLYNFSFLGGDEADFGGYFWMTTDYSLAGVEDEVADLYKAPPYKTELKIVK